MPSEKPVKHKYRLQFVPSAWAEWQEAAGAQVDSGDGDAAGLGPA